MATRGHDGEWRRSRRRKNPTREGERAALKGEWKRRVQGVVVAWFGGEGGVVMASSRRWRRQRSRLARWHSTEQLGRAGQGRRPCCPRWAGWAGWAALA